jgi:flagella basal body P-ring formation protein FlgA
MRLGTALIGLILLTASTPAHAERALIDSRPKIFVNPQAIVRGEKVYLGDIAKITAKAPEHARLVADLKALFIAEAPPPKLRTGIPGAKILSLIEAQGIQANTLAYSIPQIVELERAGRVLGKDELMDDVRVILGRDPTLDIQVREVSWENAQILPLGVTTFEIERLGEPSAGKVPLRVLAKVDGAPAARFMVTAIVDDWRSVPVLKKTLERGMLITPQDVELVRLNMIKQPQDVADTLDDVLGRAVKSRLNAGETLRKGLIDIPPLVPQGKQVVLVFRSGVLQATATGVALDNGLRGEIIRVKNESSKKVVRAKILNESELEVQVQ